ncbi:putative damage-inducible protein DinB [Deinobacterium chartae]|uniref:Putative damage-inducible protein DinB n=1 Tax=Deinobacterium chartae TaxID=521158 RepID=A0A841HVE9_9DEIO|nr:DinB family protein [Deinobacterium chartae]MBB6097357.1 putative damage-inducible protein DinB [Deinobacterium chartae]
MSTQAGTLPGVQDFLLEAFRSEYTAFRKALEGVPAELFAAEPTLGGHSPAWHALHIADWTRLFITPGLGDAPEGQTYAYLGWENSEFAQKLLGPSPAAEHDGKDAILAALDTQVAQALTTLEAADTQRFAREASARYPMGPRAVLAGLSTQLRHIAYHRGQVRQTLLQLTKERM